MFYLGSHKGIPTDNYAHSSPVMESFKMKTKPSYMHRKILAYGSYGDGLSEDMLVLEGKLQENRKERCWDRYYNDMVCDGVYHGFSAGVSHPNWKGGITVGDNLKTYIKKHNKTPAAVASRKKYRENPESKLKRKTFDKKRNATPERKAYDKKRNATPERKASLKICRDKLYAKNKAETGFARGYSQSKKKQQGQGTLENFL